MAGSAFHNAEILQKLQVFVPVLVDGDTEKDVCTKFSVSGYPHIKFVTAGDEKVHGTIRGAAPDSDVSKQIDGALQSIGPIRLSKAYSKLLKAQRALKKAQEKGDPKKVLRAVADIEKIGHEGPELDAALAAKAALVTKATAELEAAQALLESDAKAGQAALKKIKSTYKGLEVAEQAAELLKGL